MAIPVFLWRGGVKHYLRFPLLPDGRRGFVYDPRVGSWIGQALDPGTAIVLVDDETWSGATLYRVAQTLERAGYHVVGLAADIASGPRDGIRPLPAPTPASPLVALMGLPGTGKSALARMLAHRVPGVYVKWSRVVTSVCHPGRYGEEAARLEAADPLVFARLAVEQMSGTPRESWVILDGVKDARALLFMAFALHRPLIPLILEEDEETRQHIVAWRGDADDVYDRERRRLFADRLEELQRMSLRLDLNRPHPWVRALLARHGYPLQGTVPGTILAKRFLVDFVLHNVLNAQMTLPTPPEGLIFHTRYSRRYPVPTDLAPIVNTVASAFRILDDILDEATERRIVDEAGQERHIPAAWVQIGVWRSVFYTVWMLAWARSHAPDTSGYDNMLRRVASAVRVELRADEEQRPLTRGEYQTTLDREGAFREWVARLSGYPLAAARKEGIDAQKRNDTFARGIEALRLPSS